MDLALNFDLVEKSGAWFSMGEHRMGQGREAAKQFLKDHPELRDRLEQEIKQKVGFSDQKSEEKSKSKTLKQEA